MRSLRVASVQMVSAPLNKEANLGAVECLAARAARRGARLAAFPECCITGYEPLAKLSTAELRDVAERVPSGTSVQRLLASARRLRIGIGAGLIERRGSRLYKSYVLALPDGRAVTFYKFHPFVHPALELAPQIARCPAARVPGTEGPGMADAMAAQPRL
jgi:predicted amidohydrolase